MSGVKRSGSSRHGRPFCVAVCLSGSLATAAGIAATADHCVWRSALPSAPGSETPLHSGGSPSRLDYVVLASLADASSLLSLTAYRTPAVKPADAREGE